MMEVNEPKSAPSRALTGRRVLVLLFSHYLSDPRPRRAAELLVRVGMEVEVICLQETSDEALAEQVNGVSIRRLPIRKRRGGKLSYIKQYLMFILGTFFIAMFRSLRRHYHLVHVHNMPDVLVFAALVPKLLGSKVILDLHDPMPELMMTIFELKEDRRGVRLLKRLEKLSIWFADAVVAVNLACVKIFTVRSCPAEKLHVVMNSPDESIFLFRDSGANIIAWRDLSRPFVMMYHGSIVERHGLDLAVQALESVRETVPNAVLRVYGRSTPFLEQVMADVKRRGLQDAVQYLGAKNLNQLVEAIDACDVGVIPNRRSIFTEINTPTRIFEYLARGKAVIAPRARGILDYFSDDSLVLFALGNAEDLASKMRFVHDNPSQVNEVAKRGQAVYQSHRWSKEQLGLLALVETLLGKRKAGAQGHTAPATVHTAGL